MLSLRQRELVSSSTWSLIPQVGSQSPGTSHIPCGVLQVIPTGSETQTRVTPPVPYPSLYHSLVSIWLDVQIKKSTSLRTGCKA